MLSSLHISNAAVIRSVDLDFSEGFTVLSGETGAGKSVILGCLGFLLGEKQSPELIRSGENQLSVSGMFTCLTEETEKLLEEYGVEVGEDGLYLQRTLSSDGKTQIRMNGRAVTLSILRDIGKRLVSIHGQNDNHALTDPQTHRQILDLFAENKQLLGEYQAIYAELEEVRRSIREITEKESERERLSEILAYQVKDIDSVSPTPGEEDELLEKKLKIRSAEKINKQAGFVYKALKGSEKGSVAFLLDRSINALTSLSDVIPAFAEYAEKLRDQIYTVEDIAEEVLTVLDECEDDSESSLNSIEERLDQIAKLKRKYGLTIEAVLAFRENAAAEYEALTDSVEILEKQKKKEIDLYNKAEKLAERIFERRKSAAKVLEGKVLETLAFLDMPKVVFFAKFDSTVNEGRVSLNKYGKDEVEFYISPNLGAEPQPLAKIASGGEIARVMLAVRSAIADKDGISTVIFDEIDAGVSGKTARKIGIKMLNASENSQIVCVTHSAQIASLADLHYLISKKMENESTETRVTELDDDGRIRELSRILGGIAVTEAQRNAAVDMLKEREEYRKI